MAAIHVLMSFACMNLDELTYRINVCAMEVHNELEISCQEVIYQRCVAIAGAA